MQHFTRRETVILTRTSPTRLAYLSRIGVIVPIAGEGAEAKQSYYTWEQILELRAIRRLRHQVSLQMIRKILAFLEGSGCGALHDKHLVIEDGAIHWVQSRANKDPQVVQVAARADRHVGQFKLVPLPSLIHFADDGWEPTYRSKVVDFESFRQRVVPLRPR